MAGIGAGERGSVGQLDDGGARAADEDADVTMTADGGLGSTWSFTGTFFGFHQDATFTRDEYVPNERIVDKHPIGGIERERGAPLHPGLNELVAGPEDSPFRFFLTLDPA